MATQKEFSSNKLKYLTKMELIEESIKVKKDLYMKLVDYTNYLLQDYENDVEHLISMFYNEIPYCGKEVEKITKKLDTVLQGANSSILLNLITALKLGYQHHVELITTSKMCDELGITRAGLERYLFDVNDPESVKKAQQKKHPMIPIKNYVRIIYLAEKQDFEKFKVWYLNKKKKMK